MLNYCPVESFTYQGDKLSGLQCRDKETDQVFHIKTKCVVNATGVWVDSVRSMDKPISGEKMQAMVTPSQGVHLVVDKSFLGCEHALLIPSTQDGRVLFAVPWLGKVILGTTDTPRSDLPTEPLAFAQEVHFILEESARYLSKAPTTRDVRSVWVGLRPLVKPLKKSSTTFNNI